MAEDCIVRNGVCWRRASRKEYSSDNDRYMHAYIQRHTYIHKHIQRACGGKPHRWQRPDGSAMVLGDEEPLPSSLFNQRIESYQSRKRISNGSCVMSLLSHDSQTGPCTSFRVMSFPPWVNIYPPSTIRNTTLLEIHRSRRLRSIC